MFVVVVEWKIIAFLRNRAWQFPDPSDCHPNLVLIVLTRYIKPWESIGVLLMEYLNQLFQSVEEPKKNKASKLKMHRDQQIIDFQLQ